MSMRDEAIADFLAAGPFKGASRAPLAGDASNRRYERISHPRLGRAVLMDAPPEKGEDVRPFLDVTARLRALGLSAPEVLDADETRGFLLLEDLGDALFARVLARAEAEETELYAAAIDLLVALHASHEAADGLAPYDLATCRREAALLTDWYLPAATGHTVTPGLTEDYLGRLTRALSDLPPAPTVCVLRDYHAENLIWLPDRKGHARIGLLDYQDALAGHPAYDIVSLLEDARRDTSADLRAAMLSGYAAATGMDQAVLAQAYAVHGAQRNLKIMGIFARLWLRDGKPAYLALMPRVWAHLERDLSHPSLAALRDWVGAHVPPPESDLIARLRGARP
ncbi:phosphotransferase [Halovulum dunhuangense]|uniref:Phosphotransferase n=1 Tax=Halovulum dunhuangense TaxID=1505036 RepID=A0A849KZ41_9RHOB|nr:phosphotransferase [Halovulum dunhuangense]NNU79212.1 phosphotransferase [Halovulum dunhuangense]